MGRQAADRADEAAGARRRSRRAAEERRAAAAIAVVREIANRGVAEKAQRRRAGAGGGCGGGAVSLVFGARVAIGCVGEEWEGNGRAESPSRSGRGAGRAVSGSVRRGAGGRARRVVRSARCTAPVLANELS